MMEVIEKKIGEDVSPAVQEAAKSLRYLASLVEAGNVVGVAFSWVAKEDNTVDLSTGNTFCADKNKFTLLGCVAALQAAMTAVINE